MAKRFPLACAAVALVLSGACGAAGPAAAPPPPDRIVLGFSQVGSESGWRAANTQAIQLAAASYDIDLRFADADQEQDNQISAIRNFIRQKVDVIAFSPVIETGWDEVLLEAKIAGIPVVLTDRAITTTDETLYVSLLGSDFVEQGRKAGKWVAENSPDKTTVVEIEGTAGAAPAVDRKAGFAEAVTGSGVRIAASKGGEFTTGGGKRVMTEFLDTVSGIDVVFAHNDDMGLGAIEAIKAAGKTPGDDIKVVTVDAVRAGMTALANGEISYIVECNPLIGGQLMELVQDVVAGDPVPKRVTPDEGAFTPEQARYLLPTRKY